MCIRGHFSQTIPQTPILIELSRKQFSLKLTISLSLFRFQFFTAVVAINRVVWVFLAAIRTNYLLFLNRPLNIVAGSLKSGFWVLGFWFWE